MQFKETYAKFIVTSLVKIKREADFRLAYAYYLILQDRLISAQSIIDNTPKEMYSDHEVQFDYMRCYLDMSLNTLNFTVARTIAKKYQSYDVESWAKLFRAVAKTLELDDEVFEEDVEKKKVQEYHTKVVQD